MATSMDYAKFLSKFRSKKFRGLWPAQAYCLGKYSESFTPTPDVAIELPTGAGKTLIALLIAEAWRREGKTVASA